MVTVNDNFTRLNESYLFSTIAHRVDEYKRSHPYADIIKMGIGDVTLPLAEAVCEAMAEAVKEMASSDTFHGYGPEQGYEFLRKAVSDIDYKMRDINIEPDEIFISDGAKSDTANILDLFGPENTVALTDPVYPVYLDSNIMAGRAMNLTGHVKPTIVTLACSADNGYVPALPDVPVDIIYLCYPNNPTGTTLTRAQLKVWVDYALANQSIILFDSAYEAYIAQEDVPHSIYEIDGADRVAIEFRSYSKTAGFTGIRCGYTVVPKALIGSTGDGETVSLNRMWNRRQSTKFNGASYISQRGAAAIYTPRGRRQVNEAIDYYMTNAALLRDSLSALGYQVVGGVNAPYIWLKTPNGYTSWQYFEYLLDKYQIVVTPGVGFGAAGEGYVRLTAFNTREATIAAIKRLNGSATPYQQQC